MYHPSSERVEEEYIELYNHGTNTVSLQGWQFSRGVSFTFTNDVMLAPGEYLVVAADPAAFSAKYPLVANVVGGWTGQLSNSGEDIELENALGEREDLVSYADDGDWGIRVRGPLDSGHYGWEWFAEHDGLGKSLELRNPDQGENTGQNWESSIPEQGTPGAANSTFSSDIAPLIQGVAHAPLVPRSIDAVTVTAEIDDESTTAPQVLLFHRNASTGAPPNFSQTPMLDDGLHNDGGPADGVYGAILPAQPVGTVIEFYVQATDIGAQVRTWPAAARQLDLTFAQTANALYQVDEDPYAGPQPMHRLIFTEGERQELASNNIRDGDAQMNGTFITTYGGATELRYNVGVRIRGAGSRNANVPNYRVIVPSDRTWNSKTALNHNAQFGYAQVVGAILSFKAGLPTSNARSMQVRVNGANLAGAGQPQYSSYALLEVQNGEWAASHYPEDPNGNTYSARRTANGQDAADLRYHGTNYLDYIANGYNKTSNQSENDWSDLIELTDVMNNEPDATYAQEMYRVADVKEWMKYFAFFTVSGSGETSLGTGFGDDYNMYAGQIDRRMRLLAHDLDTILGEGQGPGPINRDIFVAANSPSINRFLRHPEFAPLYYAELKHQIETVFSPVFLDQVIEDLLADYVPAQVRQSMKTYAEDRNAYVLSVIPQTLTVNSTLPVTGGYPRTTTSSANLSGQADVIRTRSILVNGQPAQWTAWTGTWTASGIALLPGINRVLVQSLGADGLEFARQTIDIWYDDGNVFNATGTLATTTTWPAVVGPILVTGTLTVPQGLTLNILPGTSVYFAPGASLVVNGRLVAEGTETQRIRFTRDPSGAGGWNGIHFNNTQEDNRIAYADFDYASGDDPITLVNSRALIDHATWSNTLITIIDLLNSSLIVRNSVFPTINNNETIHGMTMPPDGYVIIESNYFGGTTGYSDIIDFTGGQRPGPILQVYHNIFNGGSDDALDLDGTDAHIEGNVFMNIHQDAVRDSGSYAIATDTESDVTVVRNIFYNTDHALLLKNGARATFQNNTVYGIRTNAPAAYPAAVIAFGEPDRNVAGGAEAILDGNIMWDIDQDRHFLFFTNGVMNLAVDYSILSGTNHPGTGNLSADPLFVQPDPSLISAATIPADLALRTGSPAESRGPNGLDMGALVPGGASISGEPPAETASSDAVLTVAGPGITDYSYQINDGPRSAIVPVATPLSLSGLADGAHTVKVYGVNSAGVTQPEPTLSRTWTVNSALARVVLSEVLALNRGALTVGGELPDLVELHNPGALPASLALYSITDNPSQPTKFIFPSGTSIDPGGHLMLVADNEEGLGIHLGFALDQDGEGVYLYNPLGVLVDYVEFGIQAADYSLSRRPDDTWGLGLPTLGGPNQPVAVADGSKLKVNEWLAAGNVMFPDDFIEIYNPDAVPASLGGLHLTDEPIGAPGLFQIAPLSFIAPKGHVAFLADSNPGNSGRHVNFSLSGEEGRIALVNTNLEWIDCVYYGPQTDGVSEGRRPDGSDTISFFGPATQSVPTPGAANPGQGVSSIVSNIVVNLLPLTGDWRYESSGTDLQTGWRANDFDDSAWDIGPGIFYNETPNQVPNIADQLNTFIPFTNPQQTTFYFRTTFQVATNLDEFRLVMEAYVDDGAVIYLNGTELQRIRMPGGTITYNTFANQTAVDGSLDLFELPPGLLLQGPNRLAVEVHQQSTFSSDMVFGLGVSAVRSVTNIISTIGILNEVLASNQSLTNSDGTLTDYVELHNPSPFPVMLADQSLTDTLANPRRWVFPAGANIPAGGHLIVCMDPDNPPSLVNGPVLNTGFGLDNKGDQVLLFDSPGNGGALLDSISFGLQVEDFAIGRTPDAGAAWKLNLPTPGSANLEAALGNPANLAINEWMADPRTGDDWFELYNPNNQPVALGGLHLTDDLGDRLKHRIDDLSFVGSRTNGFLRFIADNNPENGADHVSFALRANGEAIGLSDAAGTLLTSITFGPQQTGVSEGSLPDGGPAIVAFPDSSTPGGSNYLPLRGIHLQEILSHTDPPLEDAIELHNLSASDIPVGGWFLSDSASHFQKFRIPDGTVIPAGGYTVFYENQFNFDPRDAASFALSSADGDELFLSEADPDGNLSGHRDEVSFGPSANGVSFGRILTSMEYELAAVSARTFGADSAATVEAFRTGTGLPNAAPLVGPVVISEIMYHPPELGGTNDNNRDEFIEVLNISGAPVELYDSGASTNTWRLRDAVDFEFPEGVILPAGGRLLVVGFDPQTNLTALAAFNATYDLAGGTPIHGPWRGQLGNDRESVELKKPDPPSPIDGSTPYVMVDEINYRDDAPWATAADGAAIPVSLQRRVNNAFGNDPVNWLAGTATPGAATGSAIAALPVITVPPAGANLPPGAGHTFQVTATGTVPRGFQWRFNGYAIPGATNSAYTIPSVSFDDAGFYDVRIHNLAGTALSAPVSLVIESAPIILQQPQDRVVAPGTTTFFSVAAEGTSPITYQWRFNDVEIPGATNPSLTLTNVQLSDEGTYSVVLSNVFGLTPSAPAQLVLNDPPLITDAPDDLAVLAGRQAVFEVVVSGSAPLGYQWRFNGLNIPGATSPSLVIPNAQLSDAGTYSVFVTNRVGAVVSPPATLTVVIPPEVTITASDPSADETGLQTAAFQLQRTGNTSLTLDVSFLVDGTATPGSDYISLVSPVHFAAGSSTALLTVTPLDDSEREFLESVEVILLEGVDYVTATPSNATVFIIDGDNIPPTVNVTEPTSGTVLPITPTNVTVRATAADADGTVLRVDFFSQGTNLIGSVNGGGAAVVNWVAPPYGTNLITAVAVDDLGRATTSAPVALLVNFPPTIVLTSPVNGSASFPGVDVPITASVDDPDGSVVRVDFYAGSTLLDTVIEPPFTTTLVSPELGTYDLRARAVDDRGMTAASLTNRIRVRIPRPEFADLFEDRGEIDAATNFVTGSNLFATREVGEPNPFNAGSRTVWISWIAPATGPATMNTAGSSFDTVLQVYTNSQPALPPLPNLVLVTQNDDGAGLQSQVTFFALQGLEYFIRVDGFGPTDSGSIQFGLSVVSDRPLVLVQPADVVERQGTNVLLRAYAAATVAFTSQWYFNGSPIPGATGLNYNIPNLQAATVGNYQLVVRNAFGSDTSRVARVEIGQPPSFLRSPASQTVVVGDTVTFRVELAGSPPFGYRWRKGFATVVQFDQGTASYTLTNVQPGDAGNYSVVVTNFFNTFPGVLSGTGTLTVLADEDGDGAPDTWESAVGLDPGLASDGLEDEDGDGVSNADEWRSGTDWQDAQSYLRVESITAGATEVVLTFQGATNKSYSVLERGGLEVPGWLVTTNIGPAPSERTIILTRPKTGSIKRYYQLVTPEQP